MNELVESILKDNFAKAIDLIRADSTKHLLLEIDKAGSSSVLLLIASKGDVALLSTAIEALRKLGELPRMLELANSNGNIALHFAARTNVECTKLLLDAVVAEGTKKEFVEKRCRNGQTALLYAIAAAKLDVVRFLCLERAASVMVSTNAKLSSLMLAVLTKQRACVQAVLDTLVDSDELETRKLLIRFDSILFDLVRCLINFM